MSTIPQLALGLAKNAATFPYKTYADVLTNVSVGGIDKGDICNLSFRHLDVSDDVIDAYKTLMQNGYRVQLTVIPESIERLISGAPHKIRRGFNNIQKAVNGKYDYVIKWGNGEVAPGALNRLLSTKTTSGKSVSLNFTTSHNNTLAEEIVKNIIGSGGIPQIVGGNNCMLQHLAAYHAASDDQLSFVHPSTTMLHSISDRHFAVYNFPDFASGLLGTCPESMDGTTYQARRDLFSDAGDCSAVNYMRRMARQEDGPRKAGDLLRTVALSPSSYYAQAMGFNNDQAGADGLGRYFEKITYLDKDDPLQFFSNMIALVGHYATQMQKFERLKIVSSDGKTDLECSIKGRRVVPSSITGNALPAEIFTTPVENSLNGKIYSELPFYMGGTMFRGMTLNFEHGKVSSIDLEEGEIGYLNGRILNKGPKSNLYVPGFDTCGELAQAFNKRIGPAWEDIFPGTPILDRDFIGEKREPHFALGAAYGFTGGQNKCDLHEDFPYSSQGGNEITIYGYTSDSKSPVTLWENGMFTDEFLNFRPSEGDIDWRSVNIDWT